MCTSTDPRNRRLRPGLKIEVPGGVVLVDTPTDFREQALRFGVPRVDAVLFTHAHADHVFGLDDLRIFNFRQRAPIACYGSASTLSALRKMFGYVFEDGQEGGGKPKLDLVEVTQPFAAAGIRFEPIPVLHGDLPVLGYRSGSFAYVTDCNSIPPESMARLRGLDVLILDALRYRSHPTHFTIDEALAVAAELAPRRTLRTSPTRWNTQPPRGCRGVGQLRRTDLRYRLRWRWSRAHSAGGGCTAARPPGSKSATHRVLNLALLGGHPIGRASLGGRGHCFSAPRSTAGMVGRVGGDDWRLAPVPPARAESLRERRHDVPILVASRRRSPASGSSMAWHACVSASRAAARGDEQLGARIGNIASRDMLLCEFTAARSRAAGPARCQSSQYLSAS